MRIMGLDVGSKTVGVAISDPLGFTAQGLEIIPIDEDKGEFGLERLTELVEQYKVQHLRYSTPCVKHIYRYSNLWHCVSIRELIYCTLSICHIVINYFCKML